MSGSDRQARAYGGPAALFSPRERRVLLWLAVGAICWRWACAVQSPLPAVDACRDLWLAESLARLRFSALAPCWLQPWQGLLLAPAVAAGADAFAAGQVLACVAGGLAVWPAALAAERLRQGAGLPAAVLVLAASGPAVAAGAASATGVLALAAAAAGAFAAAGRWRLAAPLAALVFVSAAGVGVAGTAGDGTWRGAAAALRLSWGVPGILALLSALPPRPRRLPAFWLTLGGALALGAVLPGTGSVLAVWSPTVAILGGFGLARLPVRARDLLLCAVVGLEGVAGWRAIEPRAAVVERALGTHVQRRLAGGGAVASDLVRVLYFAGQAPTPARDADGLLAAAAADRVTVVVLGAALARQPTVTAALSGRFARHELPHDLGDLAAAARIGVLVRR